MPEELDLREQQFDVRLAVMALRREVYEHGRFEKMEELFAAEAKLAEISDERAAAENQPAASSKKGLLGPATTKLDPKVDLKMRQVPTSLVHLFDAATHPLVEFKLRNLGGKTKRICFTSFVEGYSAHAIDTVEVTNGTEVTVPQLPTFFIDRLKTVTELTRATVQISIVDLDDKAEMFKTFPVWLLARTTAPLAILGSGEWIDMTEYLGAYVTPNEPSVMEFLGAVAAHHPDKQLIGYQVDKNQVEPQVRAVFETLKAHPIRYVNSVIDFTPDSATVSNQRVRRPSETLVSKTANCIDGTVLFASLLEAMSLHPAIVVITGHAFLAWETWPSSNEWVYLNTVDLPRTFEEARDRGALLAKNAEAEAKKQKRPTLFQLHKLRDLRAKNIMPLE